jgi:hypothetical protein
MVNSEKSGKKNGGKSGGVHLHRHVGRRENNATASLLSPLIKT